MLYSALSYTPLYIILCSTLYSALHYTLLYIILCSTLQMRLERSTAVNQEHATEIARLKQEIADQLKTIDSAECKIRGDEALRRRLHNTILELKGNIRVFIRVRPLLGSELVGSNGVISHIQFPDDDHKKLELEKLADISPNEACTVYSTLC